MLLDKYNQYSDAQAFSSSAASTDLIDHGADRNLGVGEPLSLVVVVTTAADDGNGDETYSVALQTDDNASFSSASTVGSAITITRGDAAGTRYVMAVPADTSFEQYSRVYATLGGTTPSVSFDAYLVPTEAIDNNFSYADGITIS